MKARNKERQEGSRAGKHAPEGRKQDTWALRRANIALCNIAPLLALDTDCQLFARMNLARLLNATPHRRVREKEQCRCVLMHAFVGIALCRVACTGLAGVAGTGTTAGTEGVVAHVMVTGDIALPLEGKDRRLRLAPPRQPLLHM